MLVWVVQSVVVSLCQTIMAYSRHWANANRLGFSVAASYAVVSSCVACDDRIRFVTHPM